MKHTKTVYAYDPVSRAYMRSLTLDEGDLSPADLAAGNEVWLIPGNCLESEPPVTPPGKYAVEENGGWVLRDIPKPVVPDAPKDETPEAPTPEMTLALKVAALEMMVENNLDALARAWRYKSIDTAVSYAEEKAVPKFWAEGRMFRKLRSLTYARCYEILAQYLAGEIEEPTAETLPPMLPVPDSLTCAAEQAVLEAEIAAAAAAAEAAAAEAARLEALALAEANAVEPVDTTAAEPDAGDEA